MKQDSGVKRTYRSSVRQAQAARTRASLVAAASELFVEHGYVATTVDDIATRAGVSRATVFNAVGGKPELLIRAYQFAVRGDQPDVGDQFATTDRRGQGSTDNSRRIAQRSVGQYANRNRAHRRAAQHSARG